MLHKAHLAPASRYSEDIDLVLVGDRPAGHIKKALLQRENGRDLFDLWRAWDASQAAGAGVRVNPARVGETFRFYMAQEGSTLDSTKVRGKLERRMLSRKFLADIEGFVQAGLPIPRGRAVTCSSRCFCLT